ncbi:MAG: ribulose-5-phosphate 4-epimerase-like epimerase or aldolase [Actinomycetia bacterium]|nr:ribulose-5-phosphate 4-epimerase-like epimerase or aldolase [Actinomycetes bacterium]
MVAETPARVGPLAASGDGSVESERLHRKQRLAAAFRVFGKLGFEEGLAGHITARDPEDPSHFWVNPLDVPFSQMTVSDLLLVDSNGQVLNGTGELNRTAFLIHSEIHASRPDVTSAAHSHSVHGRAWSTLGRLLAPITQDACAFYEAHSLYDDYRGAVLARDEATCIAEALGPTNVAVILKNHGLLTVGDSVDAAAWNFIAMERNCQVQLLAEAAGTPQLVDVDIARELARTAKSYAAANFQPLWRRITREQPDLLT